ncbi:MAG TPA: hypothetical protein VHV10_11690 [Ktedonobacteraceae bacterium]|jgi:hypothetical protein|nr:hypothetical protein [Ktedonobacteraceae bacterium]
MSALTCTEGLTKEGFAVRGLASRTKWLPAKRERPIFIAVPLTWSLGIGVTQV